MTAKRWGWTLAALGALVAGCMTMTDTTPKVTPAETLAVMKSSFAPRGQATLERLDQDDLQKACSRTPAQGPLPAAMAAELEKAQMATIRYPADGHYLGDWKEGEKIAQTGVGKQFSDDPSKPSGGNCYACHQLSKQEIAYGTIGPSLYHYGKLRGESVEVQKYTYGRIFNPDAFLACSNMPRFGHNGVLTEKQIKDVVALLLDPKSPVNQ
ncbi:MAG: sulfur oxidation c-type cytochrome SoxX [Proteobacteria bacterium]|nr:sulfur oxidation c-type cytochrome SoxX [Pseudomonadota bacterium]